MGPYHGRVGGGRGGEHLTPPWTQLLCSPGHHGSPLCQLGLLQSVSWARAQCGEGCSRRTTPSGGGVPPGRPEGGFLGTILGLRDQGQTPGLWLPASWTWPCPGSHLFLGSGRHWGWDCRARLGLIPPLPGPKRCQLRGLGYRELPDAGDAGSPHPLPVPAPVHLRRAGPAAQGPGEWEGSARAGQKRFLGARGHLWWWRGGTWVILHGVCVGIFVGGHKEVCAPGMVPTMMTHGSG